MLNISITSKNSLLNKLVEEQNLFGKLDEDGILKLFDRLLTLRNLPSTDSRPQYPTAYEDFRQHFINNNDWDLDYLLKSRFDLTKSNDIFVSFINEIISPKVRENLEDIERYCEVINKVLEQDNVICQVVDYDTDYDGLPRYILVENDGRNGDLRNIPLNKIKIYVDKGRFSKDKYHLNDMESFCFILEVIDFNDFGNFCYFNLYYRGGDGSFIFIGTVKIIIKGSDNTINNIMNFFENFPTEYCSLGVNIEYYKKMKEVFGDLFLSKIYAFRDCAFFTNILEEFELEDNFRTSLIRYDEHERLVRTAKYQFYNYDLDNLYSFTYFFKAKYSEVGTSIFFDFNQRSIISNRIIALIGKNGCGKTQLLTSLPIDISKKNNNLFEPRIPLFSKVISVSYSMFDAHAFPSSDHEFNYIQCGFRDKKGKTLDRNNLIIRSIESYKEIVSKGRWGKWIDIISVFVSDELLNNIKEHFFEYDSNKNYGINTLKLFEIINQMSSGQSIIFNIITEIVKNIRYDSLIIYDEPETHLHPNAISELTNTLYKLCSEFEAYCLIATHSPLIIQEILSRNVYILDREDNNLYIRHPSTETLGENLTVITNEIFGNRDIPDYFKVQLEKLVDSGLNYRQIINDMGAENIPISLNVNLYLRSLFNEKLG